MLGSSLLDDGVAWTEFERNRIPAENGESQITWEAEGIEGRYGRDAGTVPVSERKK